MRIVAVSTSSRKGEKKINQSQVTLVANHGVVQTAGRYNQQCVRLCRLKQRL